ncbi:tyrosinase family oxidase copper chaperone [Streptomyces sp. NPDC050803]|uniref:tyrosinase family oxidase copper chaperone n=1 Tax=unclassified Streptomyces TaxID=2593676 RepID=UPI003419D54C
MVVSVGGLAVGAEPGAKGQARPGPVRGRRRDLLRGLGAAVGALALAPVVAASRPARPQDNPGSVVFDETYRGRRIRGIKTSAARSLGAAEWHITVDGRRLHLMRRADGTWLSMVDHYRSYATPLEAARAAVDELGPGERLRETGTHDADTGDHHGVHP